MIDEHIKSIVKMLDGIENKENVTFHFIFSLQEHYEKIDWEYFKKTYPDYKWIVRSEYQTLVDIFRQKITTISDLYPCKIRFDFKDDLDGFYNIADYRRDLCNNYCKEVDLVCWSETDSLWPQQTLQLLELLHEKVVDVSPKYVANFADRRLWDNSFAPLHPMFENELFRDDPNWQYENEASGKAYMSLERMNEINDQYVDDIKIVPYNYPRFDGSCVCFSSELLKSGVTVPHGILLSHEDSAMGEVAKKLMGDSFIQYNFSNILHVHNRRHPNKRKGILNENNSTGFGDKKGNWWTNMEQKSKENLNNLFKQVPFKLMNC